MNPESRYLRMWSIVSVRPPEEQQKAAKRKTKKQAAKAPLFAHAGLLAPVTPEQLLAYEVKFRRQHYEANVRFYLRGFRFRWLLTRSGLVSADELRQLNDKFFAVHKGTDSAFFADYWRRQCKERGLCVS